MTITLVALGVSALSALVVPVLLCQGSWWIARPHLALIGWLTSLGVGVAGLLVGFVSLLLPVPVWQQGGCLGCGPAGTFWLSLLAALGAGGLLAFVGARTEACWSRERRSRTTALVLVAGATRLGTTPEGDAIGLIDHPDAVAFSTRSCGGHVLLSRRLTARLSADELDVVLHHERAHLRGHHESLRRLAHLNGACFPRLLGARAFESRVHLLVELIADDRAARACGTARTAAALSTVGCLSEPGPAGAHRLRSARLHERVPAA